MPGPKLTDEQLKLVYLALRCHDGQSLRPDWPAESWPELTKALDRLRLELSMRLDVDVVAMPTVKCVDCGWIGFDSELVSDDEGEQHCPRCDSVAGVVDVPQNDPEKGVFS